jgi:DNA mismatch repair ATPase MutS
LRLDAVAELIEQRAIREDARMMMKHLPDLERKVQ